LRAARTNQKPLPSTSKINNSSGLSSTDNPTLLWIGKNSYIIYLSK
jgi:hypothetical protein